MEDFVTWVDSSKIKQHVMNYNDEVSEFLGSAHVYYPTVFEVKSLFRFKANDHLVLESVIKHE